MAEGPTVANTGGSGTAVAILLGVVAIVVLLFFTGIIHLGGSGGATDVNLDTPKFDAPQANGETPTPDTPKVDTPALPAKPPAQVPSAPAPGPAPIPANGG